MPQKSVALLIILFAVILSLSISGKLNILSSRPIQTFKPKIIQTPKPSLLPLDSPVSIIKEFLSPSPKPQTLLLSSISASESFKSVKELQQSLNISLDLSAGGTPFGGRIEDKIDCDAVCVADKGDIGTYIKVGEPRGGEFMKTPFTKVYEYKSEKERNWTLGLANNNDKVCKKLNIAKSIAQKRIVCDKKGEGKEIQIMGTSQ